jgi:TFIIF-interacting CTD phosphatase-like protein
LGEVYLFTASTKTYSDPIIDEIDPKGIIKKRFYRKVKYIKTNSF